MLRSIALGTMLCGALLVAGTPAVAQVSDATRKEARERFDRGLRLFNDGDNGGALAEILEVYELLPNPVVLFNIARVYAVSGRPVKAVETYDQLLAQPGKLTPEQIAKARADRAEQAARVGEIQITTNVGGTRVELDGLQVAKTPLSGPLKVAGGSHILALSAPGYLPVRREIIVSGRRTVSINETLEEADSKVASLRIEIPLLDVDVYVDGQKVGTTPFAAPIPVAAGDHELEARRAGYTPLSQQLSIAPAAEGVFAGTPRQDPAAVAKEGGFLSLELEETGASIFVNGQAISQSKSSVKLPPGQHQLRVEHPNFIAVERTVTVPAGSEKRVQVTLEPTPEYRADYVAGAKKRRFWSWTTIGTGSLIAVGSAVLLGVNMAEERDRKDAFDEQDALFDPGEPCDPDGPTLSRGECEEVLNIRLDALEEVRDREVFGWVGLGVGVAAAGAGVFLLVTGNNPRKYELRPESDVFGRLELAPATHRGGGGVAVSGRF